MKHDYINALPEDIKAAINAHAAEVSPAECCGVIIICRGRMRYVPCRNIAETPKDQFAIHPDDYRKAEDEGAVMAIVHSHPYYPTTPSEADLVMCEKSKLPWIIVNYPVGNMEAVEPSGYEAPLEGRVYSYGVLDCYTIIQDYYERMLGVKLPDFDRPTQWWERGMNLYLDKYTEAGFLQVDIQDAKVHDVILMQHDSLVPNHAGIWVGDNMFLHHFMGRLSSRDVFSGYWRKITTHCLRHGSLV